MKALYFIVFTLVLCTNIAAREFHVAKTRKVTTELLGKALIPNLPFENAKGTPVKSDYDYFGTKRKSGCLTPGPFEKSHKELNTLKVW